MVEASRYCHSLEEDSIRLGKQIGKGAFAVVHAATGFRNHKLAVKVFPKVNYATKSHFERIQNEKKLMSFARHPNILECYGLYEDEFNFYLTLDYIPCGNLRTHLKGLKSVGFPESYCVMLSAQLVLALEFLGKHGIVHRDVKPQNILIDERAYVRLADFGLAKKSVIFKYRCGTLAYMAPEVINACSYGKSVDWWALGAIVVEAITGARAFRGKTEREVEWNIRTAQFRLNNSVDETAKRLINGLLEIDIDQRFGCGRGGPDLLKMHDYFKDVNWDALKKQEIEMTFRPYYDETDLSVFDPESEISKCDSDSATKNTTIDRLKPILSWL